MLPAHIRSVGHSAKVQAMLRVGGIDYPLASVGPDYCVLREAQEIDANSAAELILTVDGTEYRWNVVLKDGAVPFEEHVEFATGNA